MKKILNIGSCNIDEVYGVPHFVQGGETLASTSVNCFPGGKGLNQSVALARAGGAVYHAGRIGQDGMMLYDVLAQSGVDVSLMDTTAKKTGKAIIQVSTTGQNAILLSAGANHTFTPPHIDQILDHFETGDMVVLQNEINEIPYVMERAAARGLAIAFNPSPMTEQLLEYPLHLVSCFLLNEIEGEMMTGERDPEIIAKTLQNKYENAIIVQTIGKDGVICYAQGKRYFHRGYPVQAVDTTAAGDTFTGFFLASLADGESIEESLKLASVAASIAVSREGASISIPTRQEVLLHAKTLD